MKKKILTVIIALIIATSYCYCFEDLSYRKSSSDCLRPISTRDRVILAETIAQKRQQALTWLHEFTSSPMPSINPSLTTIINLLREGRDEEFFRRALLAEEIGSCSLHVDIFGKSYVGTENRETFIPGLVGRLAKRVSRPVDVHVMVRPSDYGGIEGFKRYLGDFIENGATFVTVHMSAFHQDGYGEKEIREVLQYIKSLGAAAGLAINPGEDVREFSKFEEDMDFAMVMTVVPGASGKGWEEAGFNNIVALNNAGFRKPIAADGSINPKTINRIIAQGARWLVFGSYYFSLDGKPRSDDQMREAHESLVRVVLEGRRETVEIERSGIPLALMQSGV